MNEDKEFHNIIGERIKSQRQKLRIRNIDIADSLGVNKSTVSNWITGHRIPDTKILPDLATILNTSTDYLTGKSDNPLPEDYKNDVREFLETKELYFKGEVITDDVREALIQLLNAVVKPSTNKSVDNDKISE
ncbi:MULTISPECIES: helix-turn-helix domain-containing protein [Bacillaceae]|uniref:helix-turn-helix domain-containing protein n=1 Tax=Bacillaceae TaxID=186817 RepID=UPI002354FCC4|nr:helix-turn-helix transcriptional regulator [Bacillus weihaiensis]